MAIQSLSPNSILSNPSQVNPQVKSELQNSLPQVAQDAQKTETAAQTDTVTISAQALKMADDKDARAKEADDSAEERRSLESARAAVEKDNKIDKKNADEKQITAKDAVDATDKKKASSVVADDEKKAAQQAADEKSRIAREREDKADKLQTQQMVNEKAEEKKAAQRSAAEKDAMEKIAADKAERQRADQLAQDKAVAAKKALQKQAFKTYTATNTATSRERYV